ncbi:MAG: multidrug effflux MFS transporter [Rhizobiaceae bacterium]
MSERRVSLLGALLVALGPLSMGLFTPAMPHLVDVFGTTESAVKMTLSMFFAGFASAQLVCGPLSDGFGRKPITFAFLAIYIVGSLGAVFAPTVEFLIAARFVQGVGAAVGIAIARALVRDLFTGEASTRIMNLTAVIMGIAPALAPTIGGLLFETAGWQAIFVLMALGGVAIGLVVRRSMVETVARDLSRIRPRALLASYGQLLTHREFLLTSVVLAGSVGALYTQATILPFVLMDRVGLSPTEFGAAMLFQSGSFFIGSLTLRQLMRRTSTVTLVLVGIAMIVLGSVALAVGLRVAPPTLLGVMAPCACYTFGVAFVMPALSTASLAPFPRIAGSASSMAGFFQMGGGLVGGTVAALIGDPVVSLATVIPAMGLLALVSALLWRTARSPLKLP